MPAHGHPYAIDPSSANSWSSNGAGGFPTGGASGNTGYAGDGEAHFNIQPTTYCNVMIKL